MKRHLRRIHHFHQISETRYLISDHFKERKRERNISNGEIVNCLKYGYDFNTHGKKARTYDNLIIIIDIENNELVTCYYFNDGTGSKKYI